MMAAELFVLRHVIDNDRPAAVTNFIADCCLDVEFPAGQQPEGDFVPNRAGTQRSCVTRATAANPIPVVRQITSRMDATASIWETAEISAVRAASRLESSEGVFEVTGRRVFRRRRL